MSVQVISPGRRTYLLLFVVQYQISMDMIPVIFIIIDQVNIINYFFPFFVLIFLVAHKPRSVDQFRLLLSLN